MRCCCSMAGTAAKRPRTEQAAAVMLRGAPSRPPVERSASRAFIRQCAGNMAAMLRSNSKQMPVVVTFLQAFLRR